MEEKPDIVVTDQKSYQKAKGDRKTILSWEEFAADIFPKLQEEHPELRDVTLEQFIRMCPYKFEIVA